MKSRCPALILALTLVAAPAAQGQHAVPIPEKIVAQGVPPIPSSLADRFEPYWEGSSVEFRGWYAGSREMLVLVNRDHVYHLREPAPSTLAFSATPFPHPLMGAYPRPGRQQFLIASDREGREQYQYRLFIPEGGRSFRITDDSSGFGYPEWSRSGRLLALTEWPQDPARGILHVYEPGHGAAHRRFADLGTYPEAGAWSPDDGRLAFTTGWREGRNNVHLLDVATGRVESIGKSHAATTTPDFDCKIPLRWSHDGKSLYWTSLMGSDFYRLVRYALDTKAERSVLPGLGWDVEEFDLADDGRTIALISNEDGFSVLHVLDARTGDERPAPRLPPGRAFGLAFRPGSRELAFTLDACDSPWRVHSFDLDEGRADYWRPEENRPYASATRPPEVVRYPSFDGRPIPALINRPPGRFAPPHPVLVRLHGGPNDQSRPGNLFPESFLVNELGVCVIRPNVRGSTGYGSEYECFDDGPGREGAVKDVGALLDWIATQPDLDERRVAVKGHSYGGFLALAALAAFGDRIRAGIDFAGISDLETLVARRSSRRGEYGDPADEAVRATMRSISPLANAPKIRSPLLVIHGDNDPRVPVSEAAQIVSKVRANGVPIWCILGRGEGHSFTNWESDRYRILAEIQFLRTYLLPAIASDGVGPRSTEGPRP